MKDRQFHTINLVREKRIQYLKELGWKQNNWNKWYDPSIADVNKRKHYKLEDAYKAAKTKAIINP